MLLIERTRCLTPACAAIASATIIRRASAIAPDEPTTCNSKTTDGTLDLSRDTPENCLQSRREPVSRKDDTQRFAAPTSARVATSKCHFRLAFRGRGNFTLLDLFPRRANRVHRFYLWKFSDLFQR